jgi:HEPN domain-containing protein
MADNFLKTAERMYESSGRLHNDGHHHNACYLAGYVAECYLKILVENTLSVPARAYSHKISDLHYALSSSTTIPNNFRTYLLDMPTDCPNIHSSWNPAKRYDDASGWDNPTLSLDFQVEREKCFLKIVQLRTSGII